MSVNLRTAECCFTGFVGASERRSLVQERRTYRRTSFRKITSSFNVDFTRKTYVRGTMDELTRFSFGNLQSRLTDVASLSLSHSYSLLLGTYIGSGIGYRAFLRGESRCQLKVTTNCRWKIYVALSAVSANDPATNGSVCGATLTIISSFNDVDIYRCWRRRRRACEPSVVFGIYAWTRSPVARCRRNWPYRSFCNRSTRSTPNDIRISCATLRPPPSRARSTFSIKYREK